MFLYKESPKEYTENCWDLETNSSRLQDTRSVYKNQFYLYTITMRNCYWVQAYTACCWTGQWIDRWVAGAKKSDFLWKVSRPRRWWASIPENHLAQVRIQASLILKEKRISSNISWPWSFSRGDVLISSFLQLFTDGPGQDVSCELTKSILA